VRLEGLGKLKKIQLTGTRTRDLPACSIVPQPNYATVYPQSCSYALIKHYAMKAYGGVDVQIHVLLVLSYAEKEIRR
jgi:hypothetical protein